MEVTNIIVHRAIFISLTSEVIVEVIIMVNLGPHKDRWSSALGCQLRCLQSVITLMDVSDMQLSSGRLLCRHVFDKTRYVVATHRKG